MDDELFDVKYRRYCMMYLGSIGLDYFGIYFRID